MSGYEQAVDDFKRARRRAEIEELLAGVRGKSAALLRYEEVREKLNAVEEQDQHLEDIPIQAIVGSVNRYTDFTRSFLPRRESDQPRWTNIKMVLEDTRSFPPIIAYKVGEAYFVLDGHHRVSVARQLGAKTIQGYVTQVITRVTLEPDDQPDDLIMKAERVKFLEKTRFDEIRPEAEIEVSAPGQYQRLTEHINVYRYFMGEKLKRPIGLEEAVNHWYDNEYMPVVRIIRRRGLLRDFPGRSETDLFLWLSEYNHALEKDLGWDISTETAANELSWRFGTSPRRWLQRVVAWLRDVLTPDDLEEGPEPGEWRRTRFDPKEDDHIFNRIMITVPGQQYKGWAALNMAISFAQRESAWLGGLHVVRSADDRDSEPVKLLESAFNEKLAAAGVPGKMVVEVGQVTPMILRRSRWTDLVVFRLAYPPPIKFLPRLSSNLRRLIQRCPSPLLAVPEGQMRMHRLLLAFDNSPKAREALFMAAYLAGRWKMSLTVLTVGRQPNQAEDASKAAREYLEAQGVFAYYECRCCKAKDAILSVADDRKTDLIVMGGYGARPWRELFIGSTVDHVLQNARVPVLICR